MAPPTPPPSKPAPLTGYTGDLQHYGPPKTGFNSQDILERQRIRDIIGRAFAGVPSTPNADVLWPAIQEAVNAGISDDQIVSSLRTKMGLESAATSAATTPTSAQSGAAKRLDALGNPTPVDPTAPQPAAPNPVDVHQSILDTIMGMRPNPKDAAYQGAQGAYAYTADIQTWAAEVDKAVATQAALDQQQLGVIKLPNGQLFFKGDFDKLTPQEQAQIGPLFEQQSRDVQNAYNETLNKYNLQQFTTANTAANTNNDAAAKEFQSKLDVLKANLDLGKIDQDTALNEIARSIKGMTESDTRATYVDKALADAAPLGTSGGKTAFTPDDLGSAVAGLSRAAGLPTRAPLLSFTGVRNVDPQGQLDFQDQRMGVGGPLAAIPHYVSLPPGFNISPSDIPARPQYQGAPSLPSFVPPQPPVPTYVPRRSAGGYPGSAYLPPGDYE